MSENSNLNEGPLKLESHCLKSLEFIRSNSRAKIQSLNLHKQILNAKSTITVSMNSIDVSLSYETEATSDNNSIFTLKAEYVGRFIYDNKLTEQQIENFAKVNAPAIIFPMLRASISLTTLAGEVPPLVLPMINFVGAPAQVEKL